jgi:ABC-type phosphate/phosphonate transport system ATPase subunit
MASISLKKISKAWGSVVGVDAIDLEIKDKEFIVFPRALGLRQDHHHAHGGGP